MSIEEQPQNVTDFISVREKHEQVYKRGLFLSNDKTTFNLSLFLHRLSEEQENNQVELSDLELDTVEKLMPDFPEPTDPKNLTRIRYISRQDINILGKLAQSIDEPFKGSKKGLCRALVELDREFVRIGGSHDVEFEERMKIMMKRK